MLQIAYVLPLTYLDFEQLIKTGIDAIQVNIFKSYEIDVGYGNYLSKRLCGWDCDTILAMNLKIILTK